MVVFVVVFVVGCSSVLEEGTIPSAFFCPSGEGVRKKTNKQEREKGREKERIKTNLTAMIFSSRETSDFEFSGVETNEITPPEAGTIGLSMH